MRMIKQIALGFFLSVSGLLTAQAWQTSGTVFCDTDQNGQFSSGDLPIQGVLVVVQNASGTFSNTAITSAQGTFGIPLPDQPDTYTETLVASTLPALATIVFPQFGDHFFLLSATQTTFVADFLISSPACSTNGPPLFVVSTGRVVCEANANGIADTNDTPLAGVRVVVLDLNGPIPGSSFSNSAVTGPDGSFVVDLPPLLGQYLEFLQPDTLPPLSSVQPPSRTFILMPARGQTLFIGDFLVNSSFCRTNGSTSGWATQGRVLCDVNENNQFDPGDLPLPGVRMVVTDISGSFSNSTVTGPNGDFFLRLPGPGFYFEFPDRSTLPSEPFVLQPPGNFFFSLGSTPATNTTNFLIFSPACSTNSPPSFSTVRGHVFCDANANGRIDSNDAGLAGVLVVVSDAGLSPGTIISNVALTGPDGSFLIHLPPVPFADFAFLLPSSLPPQSTVTPLAINFSFAPSNQPVFIGDFLVSSPFCPTNAALSSSGRATGVLLTNNTVGPATIIIADTGPLPSTGGELFSDAVETNLLNALTIETADALTVGSGNQALSGVTLINFDLSFRSTNGVLHSLSFDRLEVTATATCTSNGVVLGSSNRIDGLVLDGTNIVVTGLPNQVVSFNGGSLAINAITSTNNGSHGEITVASIFLRDQGCLTGSLGLVQADITCSTPSPPPLSGPGVSFGRVLCDANLNGLADAGDIPVPSLLVVVTNLSGTFSNANWTMANGTFVVELRDVPDSYGGFIHPLTLPVGTAQVLPAFNTFAISSERLIATNNFLLLNPRCATNTVALASFVAWLQQNGLPTDGSADFADSDGDGLNNWQEWIAGTNPSSNLSALRLVRPTLTGSGVTLAWESVSNRTYFVERSSPAQGQLRFLTIQSNIVGQFGTTSVTDTNGPVPRSVFYRVGVQP